MAAKSARGKRGPSPAFAFAILIVAVLTCLLLHLGLGSSASGKFFKLNLSFVDVIRELLRGDTRGIDPDNTANVILWQLRLPRALACIFAGGILGMVGSAFQALFRNPLADPYIVGVSSGAAVGGALAIALGMADWVSGLGLMTMAFLGGISSLAIVFGLASRRGAVDVETLLLAGVVVGSMLSAVLALILIAAGQDANQILRWMLGSTTPMFWNRLAAMAVAFFLGGAILALQTKRLNAFAVGEDSAQRLGVDTRKLKFTVLVTGTAMAAVAVGTVGIIGFLGLVAPHISRRLVGVDWRASLIGAGLTGMIILLLADILAQWALPGGELPVGIVTALIGAPFLIVLLRREQP